MNIYPNISEHILEPLGIISGFNIADTIWERYEKFAITKINDATLKLRGSIHYLKDLTPDQARKEAESLTQLKPFLAKIKLLILSIHENEFNDFKTAALEFFDAVDQLHTYLMEISDIDGSYQISMPVLAKDWDEPENDHWDNY